MADTDPVKDDDLTKDFDGAVLNDEASYDDFIDIVDDISDDVDDDPASTPIPGPDDNQKRMDELYRDGQEHKRRADKAESDNKDLTDRMDKLEGGNDEQKIIDFKNKYEEVRVDLRSALEDGDTDKQLEYTEQLADMRAAARVMDSERSRESSASASPASMPELASKWWGKNRWFNDPKFAEETASARKIDSELTGSGWNKESPSYYEELDNRLQSLHPMLYSKSSNGEVEKDDPKPKPPTIPSGGSKGSTKPPSDGRIKFTKEQMGIAKELGLTSEVQLREYHKEIQLQEKGAA